MKMDKILKQAQKMQAQMAHIQEELAKERVEGLAGGGMVKAVADGKGDIVSIAVDAEVVDPEDVEMLEDLIVAAVNEALRASRELSNDRMGQLTNGLGMPGLF